jgi:hypothetical protein
MLFISSSVQHAEKRGGTTQTQVLTAADMHGGEADPESEELSIVEAEEIAQMRNTSNLYISV